MNRTRSLLSCFLLLFVFEHSSAQSYPLEWSFSPDGRMLLMGKKASTGLYDSAIIRDFYLDFSQSNYWQQLSMNYQTHTDLLAKLTVDNVVYDSIGARFKGQTSYTGTGNSQKKSFNLTIDYMHPNQDLMGYQTINLNNCFQDESFLREVFYLHQIRKHIPAAKANFVHLYINNQDWGLYPNVQQINKDFIKEWYLSNDGSLWRADVSTSGGPGGPGGGWGDGTAALNYLGADTALYQQYYTLKSTDQTNPWQLLVDVCDKVDNIPAANLPTVLPNYLDIDRTLWFLASEIAFSDDDSYVYKGKMDYYLYWESETGRAVPQEFDGNSVMDPNHVNWSAFYNETNPNYPLLNRMLAVPAWRQRYLAHLRTIIQDELDTASCNVMLNNYKNMIDALVNSDPKKLYTYAQFNSEQTVLKNFISNRRSNLLNNTEVAQAAPTILNAFYYNASGQIWTVPAENESAIITTHVTSINGIDHVTLYYSTSLVGNFTPVPMYDDGAHNDSSAGDGIYGAGIPGQAAGTYVRFYVEAAANNTAKSASYFPAGAEHDVFIYIIAPQPASDTSIVINEIMASNATVVADNAGEYDDWIELYNKSNTPKDIGGYYLTDNIANLDKWMIPLGTTIPANGYLIFWADEDSSQGANHCNFKLSASEGEFVWLLDTNKRIVDSVTFEAQTTDLSYARIPNGTGNFIIKTPTFGFNNESAAVENLMTQKTDFTIYPNPASSTVNVLIPVVEKNSMLEIRNSLGQLVYSLQAERNVSFSTSNLVSGMYFVRYGNVTRRLLVQH